MQALCDDAPCKILLHDHVTTLSCSLQIVVVLSGSMEPGYWRGDILFLNMGKAPFRAGEVVVFNLKERDIPIVHRVIKVRANAGL